MNTMNHHHQAGAFATQPRSRRAGGRAPRALALFGCAAAFACGAAPEDSKPVFGEVQGAINGGDLTSGSSFSSVVKINMGAGGCTAVKFAPGRYLTAAHCVTTTARSVQLTNAKNGSGMVTYNFADGQLQIHPQYALVAFGGSAGESFYDVAVFNLLVNSSDPTSNIPFTPLAGSSFIGQGAIATGFGYGGNTVHPANAGQRQQASFQVGAASSNDGVYYISGTGTLGYEGASLLAGDSGGPLIFPGTNPPVVIGIAHGATPSAPPISSWARIQNILNWINNPVPANDPSLFMDGSSIFFMQSAGSPPLGFCITTASAGASQPPNLSLGKCDGPHGDVTGKPAGWTLYSNPNVGAEQFIIYNDLPALCMAVQNQSTLPGANVIQEPCVAKKQSQSWSFVTSGSIRVVKNKLSGLCLSTLNGSTALGANIVQATCGTSSSTTPEQAWQVIR